MASTQFAGFTRAQQHDSIIFKALAHPARIAIIDQLCERGKIICKEIELDLPLAQSSVSGHLKILLDSGILGYEKVGNVTYSVVNSVTLDELNSAVTNMIKRAQGHENDYRRTFFRAPSIKLN